MCNARDLGFRPAEGVRDRDWSADGNRAEHSAGAEIMALRANEGNIPTLHALRQAPVEELVIEGRSRFLAGRFEVLPGPGQVAGAAVEVAECRIEQVIVPQGRILAGLVQHANARLRTVDLGHDDRTV